MWIIKQSINNMDITNIWNILGITAIILLVIYFKKGRNAVWGGLTLGIIVGALIFLFNDFNLFYLKVASILGTIIGFIAELLGIIPSVFLKKQPSNLSNKFQEEVAKFNYILTTSYPDISEEDVIKADEIGLGIASKAYEEIRKGHKTLGWIKAEGLSEAKEASLKLKEYAEKDGNLDFFFGWCFAIGRDYGYGTPENITKNKDSLFYLKKS